MCPNHSNAYKTIPDKKGQERNLLDLCNVYFNIKPEGNVDPSGDPHGELTNQNVLTTIGTDSSQIIEDFGLDNHENLQSKIQLIQGILFEARQKRPRPHLDDKILTGGFPIKIEILIS